MEVAVSNFVIKDKLQASEKGLMFEKILIPLKTNVRPSFYENTLAVVNSNIVTSYVRSS